MTGHRNNRGSILIMVVGMLTVLFLLGLTFLAICRLNATQSQAMATTSQVEPVSDGLLARARDLVAAGRYWDPTNGPYGGMTFRVPQYSVSPGIVCPDGSTPYSWLSTDAVPGKIPGASYQLPYITVDVNGDGLYDSRDAYLFDTDVTNNNGDRFYAAVRISDLSALLNVNTAGDGTQTAPTWSPTNINLSAHLGSGNYTKVNTARDSITSDPLSAFSSNCAQRLFSPNAGYRPFGIGDECFLRWLKRPSMTANNSGRLYSQIGTLPRNTLASLTSFNCSNSIPRNPSASFPTKRYLKGNNSLLTPTDTWTSLDTDAARQQLYNQLKTVWPSGDDTKNQKIAHFIANLWAYLDRETDSTGGTFTALAKTYKFIPNKLDGTPEPWFVYGVTEQPVITEAFAYYLPSSPEALAATPAVDDHCWAVALEIMNPTLVPIPLRDSSGAIYSIKCNGVTFSLDSVATNTIPSTLAPGQRVVIYGFGGNSPTDAQRPRLNPPTAPSETDYAFQPSGTAGWAKTDAVKGFGLFNIELHRSGSGGDDILMDTVSPTDIGFPSIDLTQSNATTEQCADGRRDDSIDTLVAGVVVPGRNRALVATMKPYPGALATPPYHALANPKGLLATDLPGVIQGFYISLEHTTPANLGRLSNIYMYGPQHDPNVPLVDLDMPHALATNVAADVSRGKLDFRGSINSYANYPDIPAGLLFEELLVGNQGDWNRADEPGLPTRYYGKINVNTATAAVLRKLFPVNLNAPRNVNGTAVSFVAADAANYIISYRDKVKTSNGLRDYSSRTTATGIAGLRAPPTGADYPGYISASELAIPLSDYANDKMSAIANASQYDGYLEARDFLYQAISNLVTVNSDTFAVNIYVGLWKNGSTPATAGPIYSWNYLAVLDRSNMTLTRDGQTNGNNFSIVGNILTDNTKNWPLPVSGVSYWNNAIVQITAGKGAGTSATVTASTDKTLTLSAPLTTDATSQYCIVKPPAAGTPTPRPATLLFTKLND